MLEEKDDEKIRCCHHCMDTLLKRQQKLEERDHMPDIVKLYEVRRSRVKAERAKAVLFIEFIFKYISIYLNKYSNSTDLYLTSLTIAVLYTK